MVLMASSCKRVMSRIEIVFFDRSKVSPIQPLSFRGSPVFKKSGLITGFFSTDSATSNSSTKIFFLQCLTWPSNLLMRGAKSEQTSESLILPTRGRFHISKACTGEAALRRPGLRVSLSDLRLVATQRKMYFIQNSISLTCLTTPRRLTKRNFILLHLKINSL